ncbi:MAG: hypothetical protein PHW02_01965 [bacterium]|nr:hypothetical protein [bacterium]
MNKMLIILLIIISIGVEGGVLFKKHTIKDGSLKYVVEIEKEPYNRKTNMIIRFTKINNMAFLTSYYFTIAGAFGGGYALYKNGIDGDYQPSSCSFGGGFEKGHINIAEAATCCIVSATAGEILGWVSGKITSSESMEKQVYKAHGLQNLKFSFTCDKTDKTIKKNVTRGSSYLKFNIEEFDIKLTDKTMIEVYLDTLKILEYEYFPYDTTFEKRKVREYSSLRDNRRKNE